MTPTPKKPIESLGELCGQLRKLGTTPLIPTKAAMIELAPEVGTNAVRIYGYAGQAGDVIFRGFKGGALNRYDGLRPLHNLIMSDARARRGNGNAVIDAALAWLKTCGHDLYGSGHPEGPFTALAESLKAVAEPDPPVSADDASKKLHLSIGHVHRQVKAEKLVLNERGIKDYQLRHSKPANKRNTPKAKGRKNLRATIDGLNSIH